MDQIHLDDLRFVGRDLFVPESVLCTASGDVYTTNRRYGVSWIRPDGTVTHIGDPEFVRENQLVPNGIALRPDGSFLVANTGLTGGVWRLSRAGRFTPHLTEVGGTALTSVNFVLLDERDRLWITVSTRQLPRDRAFSPNIADGYVVLHDEHGTRIVADGLHFANELRLDPAGEYLYVNETYGQRMSRYRVYADGTLDERETFATFPRGSFLEGLDFDVDGGIWVTAILSNRVFRVTPDRAVSVVLADYDPEAVERAMAAFDADRFTRAHMENVSAKVLANVSSIAFGGPDLRTVYLGNLNGTQLATFRSPIAGCPPPHWRIASPAGGSPGSEAGRSGASPP